MRTQFAENFQMQLEATVRAIRDARFSYPSHRFDMGHQDVPSRYTGMIQPMYDYVLAVSPIVITRLSVKSVITLIADFYRYETRRLDMYSALAEFLVRFAEIPQEQMDVLSHLSVALEKKMGSSQWLVEITKGRVDNTIFIFVTDSKGDMHLGSGYSFLDALEAVYNSW